MMVARRNNKALPRREDDGFYDLRSYSTPTTNKVNTSAMKIYDKDEESNFIEAIVFTSDFLSCTEKPLKGSRWICGSDESVDTGDSGAINDDGCFGVKCRKLISYKNTEDLTQKVNDLFHRKRSPLSRGVSAEIKDEGDDCCELMFQRKRSPLSAGAAAEIRDDFAEEDDCFLLDESDHHFFSNLQRRIDDTISTCASTNPSLSQEELNHWYSSTWSSFTYYGSSKSTKDLASTETTGSNSKCRRQLLTSRFDTSSGKKGDGNAPIKPRSSSSKPNFLEDVEFKDSNHNYRMIPLPLPLPICEEEQALDQTQNEIHEATSMKSLRPVSKEKPRRRRLGRRTSNFWKKAITAFRRQEDKPSFKKNL